MGVLPRAVTTVPRVQASSVPASAGSSNPESETESDQHETIAVSHQLFNRIRRINLPLPDHDGTSTSGRNKHGKRKQRRFMNRDYLLQKVDEENEEDAADFAFNVMEFRKSPFQRLYETMSAVAALATLDALDGLHNYEEPTAATLAQPRRPYMRISRKIRHSIRECVRKRSKAKMVVQVIRDTEQELLPLRSVSEVTVELLWKNYIHRLLVHAVAQYHGLRSATVLTDEMRTVPPVVRVVITPYTPENDQQASLLYDLIRFVYTDALADALADALPNHDLCANTTEA